MQGAGGALSLSKNRVPAMHEGAAIALPPQYTIARCLKWITTNYCVIWVYLRDDVHCDMKKASLAVGNKSDLGEYK